MMLIIRHMSAIRPDLEARLRDLPRQIEEIHRRSITYVTLGFVSGMTARYALGPVITNGDRVMPRSVAAGLVSTTVLPTLLWAANSYFNPSEIPEMRVYDSAQFGIGHGFGFTCACFMAEVHHVFFPAPLPAPPRAHHFSEWQDLPSYKPKGSFAIYNIEDKICTITRDELSAVPNNGSTVLLIQNDRLGGRLYDYDALKAWVGLHGTNPNNLAERVQVSDIFKYEEAAPAAQEPAKREHVATGRRKRKKINTKILAA